MFGVIGVIGFVELVAFFFFFLPIFVSITKKYLIFKKKLFIGIFSGIIITLCGVWIMQNGSPFSKNRGFSSQSGSSNQLDSSEHLAPRVTRISQFNPFKSNAYQPVPENEGTELIRSTKKEIGDSKNMA
jgi:hypothetical protein